MKYWNNIKKKNKHTNTKTVSFIPKLVAFCTCFQITGFQQFDQISNSAFLLLANLVDPAKVF